MERVSGSAISRSMRQRSRKNSSSNWPATRADRSAPGRNNLWTAFRRGYSSRNQCLGGATRQRGFRERRRNLEAREVALWSGRTQQDGRNTSHGGFSDMATNQLSRLTCEDSLVLEVECAMVITFHISSSTKPSQACYWHMMLVNHP